MSNVIRISVSHIWYHVDLDMHVVNAAVVSLESSN